MAQPALLARRPPPTRPAAAAAAVEGYAGREMLGMRTRCEGPSQGPDFSSSQHLRLKCLLSLGSLFPLQPPESRAT